MVEDETKLNLSPDCACFLLSLLFDSEDGDMFLRNIGIFPKYTALRPGRPCLSVIF
jgi:hypothetical protein